MIRMVTLQEVFARCVGVDSARIIDGLSALAPNYYVRADKVPEALQTPRGAASVMLATNGQSEVEIAFLQVSMSTANNVLRQGRIETPVRGCLTDGPATQRRELTTAERLKRFGRQPLGANGIEPPEPSLTLSLSRDDVWIRMELADRLQSAVLGQMQPSIASADDEGAMHMRSEVSDDDRLRALGRRLEVILDAKHPAHAPELAAAINIWETDVLPHPGEEPNKSFGDAYAASVSGDHIEWVRYRKGSQKGLPDETLDRLRRVVTPGARKKGGPIPQTRK